MPLNQEEIDARITRLLDRLEKSDMPLQQAQLLWDQVEKLQEMQPA
jgi:hypothetical protein